MLSKTPFQLSDFNQFEMYSDNFADIQKTPSLPPENLRVEYSYTPMPADIIPPIGSNLLLHFYEHPDHASVLPTILKKFPRKLKNKLYVCPVKGSTVGWGILIAEGFNWFVFFVYSIIAFLTCLMAGVIWAVLKDDVQGGFGIAGFLLTFFLFCGGLAHTRTAL
jgi:hypothetical protein